MSKVVVTEFLSLDGVMQSPEKWSLNFWSDEAAQFKTQEMDACDSLLLGRVTYEGFAAAWPERSGDPYTDRMNSMPKHVASGTLKSVSWSGAQLIQGDVPTAVATLKAEAGSNMLVFGSATLVESLMQHKLVDEIRLLVYPVVLGEGKRLFADGVGASLELVESRSFATGVVAMVYRAKQS